MKTQPILLPHLAHPGEALSRRQRTLYIVVLGALTALGPFTIDLYLPAFPALERDFGVPEAVIQLTLTGTMIGFGFGQLVMGPWSDKIGRRRPLMMATAVHIIACVGAALAPDIFWLGALRLLQGFGAAAGGVVAMAMVRDLFGGRPLIKMLSRLALVTGLAPVIAPVIGSQLLLFTDWRGIFWVLAGYGAVVMLAVFLFIVETLPPAKRNEAGHTIGARYRAVLSDRVFIGVALVAGMNSTGLFSYLAASPFLFQDVYGFSPQEFGALFAVNSVGVVFGVQASSRIVRSGVGPQWVLSVTTIVQVSMAIVIIVLDQSGAGLWGTAIPLFFFVMACGFTFPCVQVLALVNHARQAGTAASLLGAMNFGLAGLLSPIVGVLGVGSAVGMGAVMGVAAVIATIVLWTVLRPTSVPALED